MIVPPTISAEYAALERWDVIVVGAGPAGSFAASALARAGQRTLLVEAKEFPRAKVCGGCLNHRARAILIGHGLSNELNQLDAIELTQLRLVCRGRDRRWPSAGSLAVRRERLDALLAQTAIESGAEFLPSTLARIPDEPADELRQIELRRPPGESYRAAARVVICADGLSHSSTADHPGLASRIRRGSRVGLQAYVPSLPGTYLPGELTMISAEPGYLGITAVDGGQLNLAAAVDPDRLSREHGAAETVREILEVNRLPVPPELWRAHWTGTPALTRVSRNVSARRLFLIGDAAGYVEPFTGEGMAWALIAAQAVVPLAVQAARLWTESLTTRWANVLKQKIVSQQWMCQLLSHLLRRPRLAALALDVCHACPPLRRMALRQASVWDAQSDRAVVRLSSRCPA